MANDDDDSLDTREIEVTLTPEEITARHASLCEKLAELDRVKEKRGKVAAAYGVEVKDLESEIRVLREAARQGRELRTVEVRMRVDHGIAYFDRTDNGETVDQRPATTAEAQAMLPHHPRAKRKPAEGEGPGGDLVSRARQAQKKGEAAPDPDDEGDVVPDGDELAARRKGPKKPPKKPKGGDS
jgi:hypothetical protein